MPPLAPEIGVRSCFASTVQWVDQQRCRVLGRLDSCVQAGGITFRPLAVWHYLAPAWPSCLIGQIKQIF